MLPIVILTTILNFVDNPWDFINLLFSITDNSYGALYIIEYFKNSKNFKERVWIFNVGLLARYTFTSSQDYIDEYITITSQGIMHHDLSLDYYYSSVSNITNNFFTSMCLTNIALWIYDDYDNEDYFKELNNIFCFDFKILLSRSQTNENKIILTNLDNYFADIYKKYPHVFIEGFNTNTCHLKKNLISKNKINKYVNYFIFPNSQFISRNEHLSEDFDMILSNKEDFHSLNKIYKRTNYSTKKKEKVKRKHRSSPKVKHRNVKYSKKLEVFV